MGHPHDLRAGCCCDFVHARNIQEPNLVPQGQEKRPGNVGGEQRTGVEEDWRSHVEAIAHVFLRGKLLEPFYLSC